jgi:hypothetical protein
MTMTEERKQATIEDIREADSIAELDAYQGLLDSGEYREVGDDEDVRMEVASRRIVLGRISPIDELRKLQQQLDRLQAAPTNEVRVSIPRAPRKYRLLKREVEWSTTPQVHAIVRILAENWPVGEVVDEDRIVEAMVLNRDVLETRQEPRRVWDYWKNGTFGLLAHGNVEKVG